MKRLEVDYPGFKTLHQMTLPNQVSNPGGRALTVMLIVLDPQPKHAEDTSGDEDDSEESEED